ncbi:hypothetical protein BKI52_18325 [marine bacterium AO1-C]|nr:hypothetical protein BKI52_18325 [marine bacterium AO1-C]
MSAIKIIAYQPHYKADFQRLSLEWLNEYDLYEDADGLVINDPETYIFAKGGRMFFAQIDEEIVGTITLMPQEENTYEILKFAVSKEYQKQGIGRILLTHCIQLARSLDATKIILETSTQLKGALKLYEKLGFQEVKSNHYNYTLSDYAMELILQ